MEPKTSLEEPDGTLSHLRNTHARLNTTDAYEMGDFFTMIRNERHLTAPTVRQYETALSSFYRHLVSQGVVNTNPMERVERPKLKDREIKYLHHKEVKELLKAIPTRTGLADYTSDLHDRHAGIRDHRIERRGHRLR